VDHSYRIGPRRGCEDWRTSNDLGRAEIPRSRSCSFSGFFGPSLGRGGLGRLRNVNVRYHERHVRWYRLSYMRILQAWYIGFKRYQLVYSCWGPLAPSRRERYVGHYYSPENRKCVTSYLGSGKTTLLSVLTGDHPQSYTQRAPTSALTLFGAPRRTYATTHLRARIGIVSPELYNALVGGTHPGFVEVRTSSTFLLPIYFSLSN
jgi:hypothetical protein